MSTDTPSPSIDSQINPIASLSYWTSTDATVNGMLGGYPQVSRIDIQGSRNFVAKLRRSDNTGTSSSLLKRSVDCGAGIGRITANFLTDISETVDVVEPVQKFVDVLQSDEAIKPKIGNVFVTGLENWTPHPVKGSSTPASINDDSEHWAGYDLIWNQWCLGHLTDKSLVAYLRRCALALSRDPETDHIAGWIIVKENLNSSKFTADLYDEEDSSVTRAEGTFLRIFKEAGLKIVASTLQRGMPRELFAVKMWALRPEEGERKDKP